MKKTLIWVGVLSVLAVGAFFGAKAMNQIALLKKFCIKLKKAQIINFGWRNATVRLFIGFKNKSDIAITLQELNLSVSVNSSEVAKVNQKIEQQVQPNSWNDVSFDITFAPNVVLKTLFSSNILEGVLFDYSKITISAVGSVGAATQYFGINSLPINVSKTLNELLKPSNDTNDCT